MSEKCCVRTGSRRNGRKPCPNPATILRAGEWYCAEHAKAFLGYVDPVEAEGRLRQEIAATEAEGFKMQAYYAMHKGDPLPHVHDDVKATLGSLNLANARVAELERELADVLQRLQEMQVWKDDAVATARDNRRKHEQEVAAHAETRARLDRLVEAMQGIATPYMERHPEDSLRSYCGYCGQDIDRGETHTRACPTGRAESANAAVKEFVTQAAAPSRLTQVSVLAAWQLELKHLRYWFEDREMPEGVSAESVANVFSEFNRMDTEVDLALRKALRDAGHTVELSALEKLLGEIKRGA